MQVSVCLCSFLVNLNAFRVPSSLLKYIVLSKSFVAPDILPYSCDVTVTKLRFFSEGLHLLSFDFKIHTSGAVVTC